jgi:prepilin-type N-terminal cleavage/methylation domain-containing protein
MKRRGFTYIEVIMAITISAAIFTAVFPLMFATVTKNRDTRLRLIAYEAASNEIEKLRESKISSLVAPNHIPFVVPEIPGAVGDVYITKALGDQKIANVAVTINWNFNKKAQKTELKTYLYGSIE